MNKTEALNKIQELISQTDLSKHDILELFDKKQSNTQSKFTNGLVTIGGIIIFLGLIILVQMNWELFGTLSRIAITLGLAIITYASAIILERQATPNPKTSKLLSTLFHFISIGLLPIGLFVTAYELNIFQSSEILVSTIIFAILILHYALANIVNSQKYFLFLVFVYFNMFIAYLFAYLQEIGLIFSPTIPLPELTILTLGISNLLIANHYKKITDQYLPRTFFFFGTFFVLGALQALQSHAYTLLSVFWELSEFIALIALFIFGISFNRKSILIPTGIMFVVFLGNLTSKYFADSLGWPIALIMNGAILIGIALSYKKIRAKLLAKTKL